VRGDGEQVWMEPLSATDEAALDAYAERAAARDPDLWGAGGRTTPAGGTS
jgi:hypothetical protein